LQKRLLAFFFGGCRGEGTSPSSLLCLLSDSYLAGNRSAKAISAVSKASALKIIVPQVEEYLFMPVLRNLKADFILSSHKHL
jgi:hypothetical protein